MSDQSLAELLVHIQSDVQKSLEYTKFSEEVRGAGGVTMSMTDIDIELPVEINQVENVVDLSILSDEFEKLNEAERAEAWVRLPRLREGLQSHLDIAATHGGPLVFEKDSPSRINNLVDRFAEKSKAAVKNVDGNNSARKSIANKTVGRTLTARVAQSSEAAVNESSRIVKIKLSFKASLRG